MWQSLTLSSTTGGQATQFPLMAYCSCTGQSVRLIQTRLAAQLPVPALVQARSPSTTCRRLLNTLELLSSPGSFISQRRFSVFHVRLGNRLMAIGLLLVFYVSLVIQVVSSVWGRVIREMLIYPPWWFCLSPALNRLIEWNRNHSSQKMGHLAWPTRWS